MSKKAVPKTLPMLSTSGPNQKLENSLQEVRQATSILDRLLGGETALSVANDLGLPEKDIHQHLKEALALQTEFMRENAATMQMKTYLRHEALYQVAVQNMSYTETVQHKGNDGEEDWEEVVYKTDINWFREARAQLKEISALVQPFLKEAKPTGPTINITLTEGDSLYNRVMGNFADIDIFSESDA